MLAIGRALMSRPRLLLLDEPSLGLAPQAGRAIFDIILEIIRAEGARCCWSSRTPRMALEIADRAYVLETGRIVLVGHRPGARRGSPRCSRPISACAPDDRRRTVLSQQLVNGLMLGSLYALVAIGFSMIYGIVRLINFAHGDMLMIGAFATLAWRRRRALVPGRVASCC